MKKWRRLAPLQHATADGSADVEAKQNEILKNEDFMEEILSYVTNSVRDLIKKQNAWKLGIAKKSGLDVEKVMMSMKNVHQHSNEL